MNPKSGNIKDLNLGTKELINIVKTVIVFEYELNINGNTYSFGPNIMDDQGDIYHEHQ